MHLYEERYLNGNMMIIFRIDVAQNSRLAGRKVARSLTKNQLTRPKQLKVAEHPKEWLGAFEFSDAELDAIKGLCDVPAHLLRYALIAGMLIGSCIAMASGWVLMNGRRSFH